MISPGMARHATRLFCVGVSQALARAWGTCPHRPGSWRQPGGSEKGGGGGGRQIGDFGREREIEERTIIREGGIKRGGGGEV